MFQVPTLKTLQSRVPFGTDTAFPQGFATGRIILNETRL